MWDNIMNWDAEFQVQIENMENMGNMDAAPPGAAAQNVVGIVDSVSFMDRHASDFFNNPRSMDASLKPPTSTSTKLFPNATPPHMNPIRVTPDRSNMYQVVSSQSIDPPIHSDMYIAASTAMETFQSDIDDVKEDVQELNNGMQTIQKMLQQLITPTSRVKTTVIAEPSGLTAFTSGTHGPAGRY
jgi:prophage DNA circulation protein